MAVCANCKSQEGITGKVLWFEGNQMPGPGSKNKPGKGVEREIHIYEVVKLSQVKKIDGFFSDVQTKLVARVSSLTDGSFSVTLPPGEYSVFTKEPSGLFANIFDGDGKVNPIRVDNNKFEEITLKINYQAAY
jgi:hypothetical protein